MKNMKFWRTALVATLVLTVMLSVTGGTIAWFTDSVTSEVNTIKAGNLDMVLEYKKIGDETWTPVTAETELFDNSTLWEPGHTEVVALRIKNAGSLYFKYDVKAKVNEETASTNVYGDTFKLSDYLAVGHSDIKQDGVDGDNLMGMFLDSRETVQKINDVGFDASIENPTPVIAPGDGHVVALAIYMPTTVGNEANHMTGVDAPSISFGIEVEATQHTHEKDSFGMDYDEDALFPGQVDNADDLRDAMNNGEDVELGDDVEAPADQKTPYGNYAGYVQHGGVFNGGGNTLIVEDQGNNGKQGSWGIETHGGTIKNVTIEGVFRGIVLYAPTEDVIIDNVTITDAAYAINTAEHPTEQGIDLIVSDSTINGWTSFAGVETATFTNCSFGQGTYFSGVSGRLVRPYINTLFDNCSFVSAAYLDMCELEAGCKVTLKNCTIAGVEITPDNYQDLLTTQEDVAGKLTYVLPGDGRTLEDCVIIK